MKRVAIASGKGGTGKTTISTNLATFLAKNGEDVILADVDVEEPNASLFLKPNFTKTIEAKKAHPVWENENCTLCGDCAKHCHFNALLALPSEILIFPNLCHSCYACSELCPTNSLPMKEARIGEINMGDSYGVKIVEGKLDVGQEMATALIAQTLEKACERAKKDSILIYDSPPGTSCSFVETIKECDFVILITEPTHFGLNDLKIAIKTCKALDKECGVVINRFSVGSLKIEEFCEGENVEVLGKIEHSQEIAKSYAKGELIHSNLEVFKNALENIWENTRKKL
ncbi:MAG: ATP-binding protein [Sulfurospirillaceae bacterium]|nr:ATP-binding protein [Sulfurospirillaceae bacterium]MCK9546077.1 ATP-binding protein [Sulfurospirillaceae bacterium]